MHSESRKPHPATRHRPPFSSFLRPNCPAPEPSLRPRPLISPRPFCCSTESGEGLTRVLRMARGGAEPRLKLPGWQAAARHRRAEAAAPLLRAHCRSRAAPRACWWRCCCGPPGPGHSAYWMGCATAAAVGPGCCQGQPWARDGRHRDLGLEGGVGPAEEVRGRGEREGLQSRQGQGRWSTW